MIRCLLLALRVALVLGALKKAELAREAKAEREARFYGRSRWVT